VSEEGLTLLLYVVFLACAVAVPLYVLHQIDRQMRGTFGRSYGVLIEELLSEGRRRAALLARLVEAREARVARLERRPENGR